MCYDKKTEEAIARQKALDDARHVQELLSSATAIIDQAKEEADHIAYLAQCAVENNS